MVRGLLGKFRTPEVEEVRVGRWEAKHSLLGELTEEGNMSASTAPSYDVAPDGKRFLVIKGSDETATTKELKVVLSWF